MPPLTLLLLFYVVVPLVDGSRSVHSTHTTTTSGYDQDVRDGLLRCREDHVPNSRLPQSFNRHPKNTIRCSAKVHGQNGVH